MGLTRVGGYVLIGILIAGLALTFSPSRVHASTLQVPSPQYPTIQAAIDAAGPGDTVSVASGTYHETLTIKTRGIVLQGASRDNTVIDGNFNGNVVWINASNVVLSGFSIINAVDAGWGVHVENANNVTIMANKISASIDGDGVNLVNANRTLVDGNAFSSNLYAVDIISSHRNRVSNNQAVANNTIGVNLDNASRNLVFQNSFAGGQDAVDIVNFSHDNNITRNLIRDMTIFGVSVQTDSLKTPPALFPQNNTLSENTFQRNRIGIHLQNETDNTFYHNDFFQSSKLHVQPVQSISGTTTITFPNTWDNRSLGGPRGGNYWDDYNGTDANHDGIGDRPYVIGPPTQNMDSYPLMIAFSPEPVLIQKITATPGSGAAPLTITLSATLAGTLSPFTFSWSFGDGSAGSTLQSPTHTYTRPGNYTVILTTHDAGGESDTKSLQIRVSPAPPQNYFLWIVAGGLLAGLVAGLLVARRRIRRRRALELAEKREKDRKEHV